MGLFDTCQHEWSEGVAASKAGTVHVCRKCRQVAQRTPGGVMLGFVREVEGESGRARKQPLKLEPV